MSLIVENKISNVMYKVFDISYDKKGYPHFLIYKDGQWIRMSAKHFVPVEWANSIGDVALRG